MINEATAELLFEALEKAEQLVHDGSVASVAIFGGPKKIVISFDYWEPTRTVLIEQRIAQLVHEAGCEYGALVVPLVYVEGDGWDAFAPPGTLDQIPDGQEMLFAFSFDLKDGWDITREAYTRRPNGEPIFDIAQTYVGEARVLESTPGYHLLQALLSFEGDNE